MSWPPASIAANKAPGPPSSPNEHPDHHNEMATAINTVVARVDGALLASNNLSDLDDVGAARTSLDVPSFILYDDVEDEWPEATVAASVPVMWIQPNIDGSSPPSGGRPGREPGDIVLIAQG